MNPFSALLDLFIPRTCHLCGCRLLKAEEFFCSSCRSELPLTGYHKYWNRGDGAPNADLNPMETRFAGQIPLRHACAPYFYSRDSKLANLVHDFKYRGFSRLAVRLGSIGAEELKDSGLFDGVDLLLPVPLHWMKHFKRGYNQTQAIAEGISAVTAIPVGAHLRARRPHRTQTSLTHEQRLANTRDIFGVKDAADLRGRHVMLVDDICTTGATLLSAGEAVAASAKHEVKISIFTLGVVS